MSTLREALEPCPFCGGAAECNPDDIGSGGQHVPPYLAGCRRCKVFFVEEEEADAITAWNRRLSHAERAEEAVPVAWRTFDGEGGYDYRTYEENENYAEQWATRNPNHAGWVEPLYTHPAPAAQSGEALPAGWVPLRLEWEPGYPEDVAFGPQIMMDRLKKWLDRHFAALAQPAQASDDVLEALEMNPESFRTEGGTINRGKLRAAILHPQEYLPPSHWLQARSASLDEMVNRFLGWPLPRTFAPDCGISFDGRKDDEWNKNKTWPIGTNLFTASEAREMFQHALGTDAAAARSQGGASHE